MKTGQDTGIASRIVEALADRARGAEVEDVRIGLGYTAALLSSGRCGVSYTHRDQAGAGCTVFHGLRPLAGRPASEVLPLLASPDPVEAGVGLACANALANGPAEGHREGDVLEHLDLRPDDHVGMVGHFGPLVAPLRERVDRLTILEKVEVPRGDLRPAVEAPDVLPRCQVALVTATSLANRTADGLLGACAGCRGVALVGASTPLLPVVFASTAVTLLSGIVVTNPQGILRVVSEGGGMRFFGPHIRKVNLPLEGARP